MIRNGAAQLCRQWDMLPAGATVLCALSGGRDSVALLHLLGAMAPEWGFRVEAAHFNHRLRPTADRDEAFVRDLCGRWGVPLHVGSGDAAAFAAREGRSLEEAARILRYRFLEDTADAIGAERIATAHHMLDNAETLLLNLLRGTGLRGLGGIPPVRGRIVRPLLTAGREDIDRYAAENALPHVEDETNADTAFTRNRLRREILPALEAISPGCTGSMARTAALVRGEEALLQRQAEALLPESDGEEDTITLPARLLAGELSPRLVRTAAERLGCTPTARQTAAILALGAGGQADLPGGVAALRSREGLTLRREERPAPPMVLAPGTQTWGPFTVTVGEEPGAGEATLLAADRVPGPITIAPWDGTGRLGTETGRRTIKRLFADRGIPAAQRRCHPALLLGGRVIAVSGVAAEWDLLPRQGERVIAITIDESNK